MTFVIISQLSLVTFLFAQPKEPKGMDIAQLFKTYYEKSAARDFAGAIKECQRVIESHRGNSNVRIQGELHLGGSYLWLDPQEAIKHFSACIELASKSQHKEMQQFILSSRIGIAKSYMELREYEKARKVFSEIVESYRYEDLNDKGRRWYTFAIGNIIIRCLVNEAKEPEEIEKYCDKIIAEHPHDDVGATALHALREYYRGYVKDMDMAIKISERLAAEFPETRLGKRAKIDVAMYTGELKGPQSFKEDELPAGFTRGLLMFDLVGKSEWKDVRMRGYIRQHTRYYPGYNAVAVSIRPTIDDEACSYEPMVVSSSGLSPKVRLVGRDPVTGVAVMHIRGELLPLVSVSRAELSEGDVLTLITHGGYRNGKPEFWSADCVVSDTDVRTILPGAPIPAPRLVKVKGVDSVLLDCRGGVALNADGAVVGLCVKWIDEENAALILPEEWVGKIVLGRGQYSWPYTGARFKDAQKPADAKGETSQQKKILVEWIDPSGPAKDILQVGDNIVALDDVEVSDTVSFLSMISERKVGSDVKLTIERDDERTDVTLTLGSLELSDLKTGGAG